MRRTEILKQITSSFVAFFSLQISEKIKGEFHGICFPAMTLWDSVIDREKPKGLMKIILTENHFFKIFKKKNFKIKKNFDKKMIKCF